MKPLGIKPFLLSTFGILAFFLPGVIVISFCRALYVTALGRSYNGTMLAWLIYQSGLLLVFCIWLVIRASWRKPAVSEEVRNLGKKFHVWVLPWSFLLSVLLTIVHFYFFWFFIALTGFLIREPKGYTLGKVLMGLTGSWLPDPAYIIFLILLIEMYAAFAFFLALLISYWILSRRAQATIPSN